MGTDTEFTGSGDDNDNTTELGVPKPSEGPPTVPDGIAAEVVRSRSSRPKIPAASQTSCSIIIGGEFPLPDSAPPAFDSVKSRIEDH